MLSRQAIALSSSRAPARSLQTLCGVTVFKRRIFCPSLDGASLSCLIIEGKHALVLMALPRAGARDYRINFASRADILVVDDHSIRWFTLAGSFNDNPELIKHRGKVRGRSEDYFRKCYTMFGTSVGTLKGTLPSDRLVSGMRQ